MPDLAARPTGAQHRRDLGGGCLQQGAEAAQSGPPAGPPGREHALQRAQLPRARAQAQQVLRVAVPAAQLPMCHTCLALTAARPSRR